MTRILARSTSALAVAMTAALLTACATPDTTSVRMSGREPFPIVIETHVITQAVPFVGASAEIAPVGQPQLDSFLTDFMRSGGGVLEIAVASDAPSDQLSAARQEAVRKYVLHRGVRPHELRFSPVRSSSGRNGAVVVSYERYIAKAPDCDENIGDNTFNPGNQQHPNFGCAQQAQFAAMVSNPADLMRMRTEQPTDATRRSIVIQKYRAGEATEAARGSKEQATSIRSLN